MLLAVFKLLTLNDRFDCDELLVIIELVRRVTHPDISFRTYSSTLHPQFWRVD